MVIMIWGRSSYMEISKTKFTISRHKSMHMQKYWIYRPNKRPKIKLRLSGPESVLERSTQLLVFGEVKVPGKMNNKHSSRETKLN